MLEVCWSPATSFFDRSDQRADGSLQTQISRRRAAGYLQEAIAGALAGARGAKSLAVRTTGDRPGESVQHRAAPNAPFAFLSYSHRDAEQALSVAKALRDRGVTIWYDKYIGAGDTWDETLESRIREAAALVAFVSEHYDRSRYCRREIKFADLLKKPILPVAGAPHSWGEGLQFMFQELQVHDISGDENLAELYAQLQHAVPGVCSG